MGIQGRFGDSGGRVPGFWRRALAPFARARVSAGASESRAAEEMPGGEEPLLEVWDAEGDPGRAGEDLDISRRSIYMFRSRKILARSCLVP